LLKGQRRVFLIEKRKGKSAREGHEDLASFRALLLLWCRKEGGQKNRFCWKMG